MDASPFTRLPRELRDIIYEEAFCQPEPIVIRYRDNISKRVQIDELEKRGADMRSALDLQTRSTAAYDAASSRFEGIWKEIWALTCQINGRGLYLAPGQPTNMLSLTTICRQIHEESLPIIWSSNSFRFDTTARYPDYISHVVQLQHWCNNIGALARQHMQAFSLSLEYLPLRIGWNPDPTYFCKNLSRVAALFTAGDNTSCSWTLKLPSNGHLYGLDPMVMGVSFSSAKVLEDAEANFLIARRALKQQLSCGAISRAEFGHAHARLQERRQYVWPMPRRLAVELENVEMDLKRSIWLREERKRESNGVSS